MKGFGYWGVVIFSLLWVDRPFVSAAQQSVTLRGRVDVAGLDVAPGQFTIRALRAQKTPLELGKATADTNGQFQLTLDDEAVGVFGVVVQAISANNSTLVLEAPVLRLRDVSAPMVVNIATTIQSALLRWKIQGFADDRAWPRGIQLFQWLRPAYQFTATEGSKRAQIALIKWALSASAETSQNTASVLQSAVGDVRRLSDRLAKLRISPKAVEAIQELARKEPEAAYILMMPYFLEL
jgi:hypothetical protein